MSALLLLPGRAGAQPAASAPMFDCTVERVTGMLSSDLRALRPNFWRFPGFVVDMGSGMLRYRLRDGSLGEPRRVWVSPRRNAEDYWAATSGNPSPMEQWGGPVLLRIDVGGDSRGRFVYLYEWWAATGLCR